jgi:hypothetical protein
MALTPLEALNKVVDDQITDLRLVAAKTLQNLREAGRIRIVRHTQLNRDVVIDTSTAAWEPITQDGAENDSDTTIPGLWSFGTHRLKHQFKISRIAISEAKERAPGELKDLFAGEVNTGLIKITRDLNKAIFLGDGTATYGNFLGLTKVLDDAYAYAGISPVTYPSWKAIQTIAGTSGAPVAFTRDMMLQHDKKVAENEVVYNYVTMTPDTAMTYTKLFDTLGGAGALASIAEDSGVKRIELGHGGRYWNGIPIVEDTMCLPNTILTMNTNDVELFTFDAATTPAPMAQPETQIVSNKSLGVAINIAELPSNNSAVRKFEMFVIPQMRVKNRKGVQAIRYIS